MCSKSSSDASLTTTPHPSYILPENNKPSWWGAGSQGIRAMPLIWKYLFFFPGILKPLSLWTLHKFGTQPSIPLSLNIKSVWISSEPFFFFKVQKGRRGGWGAWSQSVYLFFSFLIIFMWAPTYWNYYYYYIYIFYYMPVFICTDKNLEAAEAPDSWTILAGYFDTVW